MPIEWIRHCDVYRDVPRSNTDFIALNGDEIVGRVMMFESGPERGRWMWSMVATAPGVIVTPSNGRADTRGEAGRAVVEAYERLRAD